MATVTDRDYELMGSVRSRVSWGPILAGTAVAFATYFLLNLLGAAIGFAISDQAGGETLARSAAIWSTIAVILSLGIGGWVASRFTVGEDKTEATLYGAILWGVTFILLMWMVGMGLGIGFNTFVVERQAGNAAAIEGGISATELTWWAFAGTLLSLVAAIGGALAGQGANRYRTHGHVVTTHPTTTTTTTPPPMTRP